MAKRKENYKGGLNRPATTTGLMDKAKGVEAKKLNRKIATMSTVGAGGRDKNAGMLIDSIPGGTSTYFGNSNNLDAYRNSYADGGFGSGNYSGSSDIPTYFVLMNEQNGGMLYWPTTLREKYQWYRYFTRTDAYVGRGLELLCDMPMSKVTLNMPKMEKKKKLKEEIRRFYESMVVDIGLFQHLQSCLWEVNMIGNAFCFHEWDDEKKTWTDIAILPPEEVAIFNFPFSDQAMVEYKPERLISLVMATENEGVDKDDLDVISKGILEYIPEDIAKMIKENGAIHLDTDPTSGSFVYQFSRRRSPYLDLGASVLERVLVPLLQKEHYRYTTLSLASRNMTPKNLITAPGLAEDELDMLREQVDLSYLDPDYSIVTNYEVTWDTIGADNRLLDLDSEYERIENQIFAALGIPRELLTGEGQFSGSKITVEILNQMFLLTRQSLQDYVEQKLFLPVAEAHGWYDEDNNGIKTYYYPKLGFNRLTIRDNAEMFDVLYQIYQKGSLPIGVIYELLNLDADEMNEQIYEDLFTVKDATFNRLVENVNGDVGTALTESSDIVQRIMKYLELKENESGGEEEGGFGDFGFGNEEEGSPSEEEPQPSEELDEEQAKDEALGEEEIDKHADGIAEGLTGDSSEGEIAKAVDLALGD